MNLNKIRNLFNKMEKKNNVAASHATNGVCYACPVVVAHTCILTNAAASPDV